MDYNGYKDVFKTTLSTKEFTRLGEFIQTECGIKMSASKKIMLEARLRRRLRSLDMESFSEYCDYLFSPQGVKNELIHMIDVVTTNKTDFFREPAHFDYLFHTALPGLIASSGSGIRKKLVLWSAGCSTGEEPYTLAMVLSEFTESHPGSAINYMILATDISTKVLEQAKLGIYGYDKIDPIPMEFRKKYLLRGKDRGEKLIRIIPELRTVIKFRRLNFMEGDFGMREPMDIIFCRNVIIYFDRPTQERLLNRFCRHLRPGGYIFMGHSETLHGLNVPLVQAAPMVYRKPI